MRTTRGAERTRGSRSSWTMSIDRHPPASVDGRFASDSFDMLLAGSLGTGRRATCDVERIEQNACQSHRRPKSAISADAPGISVATLEATVLSEVSVQVAP